MQIGFNLPISGPLSSPETMTRIAQHGEALGYDYLTLTDHVVLPDTKGTVLPTLDQITAATKVVSEGWPKVVGVVVPDAK